MSAGRLIAVVGPSGVGKDSVMTGIKAAMPQIRLVRRSITRAPELGGEDYEPVTVAAFARLKAEGAFCLSWGAHGLYYGIPRDVLADTRAGTSCLVNFSRSALLEAAEIFETVLVLQITAKPETLLRRLKARGRESAADIARRLDQAQKPLPDGLSVVTVANDGALADTISASVKALQPVRA